MSEQQLFFTVKQLAERWQVDPEKATRLIQNDPAVLDLGTKANKRERRRAYRQLRLPAHALARIERQLTAKQ